MGAAQVPRRPGEAVEFHEPLLEVLERGDGHGHEVGRQQPTGHPQTDEIEDVHTSPLSATAELAVQTASRTLRMATRWSPQTGVHSRITSQSAWPARRIFAYCGT